MYLLLQSVKGILRRKRIYAVFGAIILILLVSLLVVFTVQTSISDNLNGLVKKLGEQIYVYNTRKIVFDPDDYAFIDEYEHVAQLKKIALLYRINNTNSNFVKNPTTSGRLDEVFQLVSFFDTSEIKLTEGRIYENDSECCVTSEYYEALKFIGRIDGLGDKISIEDKRTNITKEFTITGVVDSDQTLYGDYTACILYVTSDNIKSYYEYYNYDSDAVMKSADGAVCESGTITHSENTIDIERVSIGCDILVILDSYENAEDFFEFVDEKNQLSALNHEYTWWKAQYNNPGLGFVEDQFNIISLLLPVISVIITTIFASVVGVMTIIFITMRKYEIGVLRSMGTSKATVALLYSAECTIFVIGAALLSALIAIPAAYIIIKWLNLAVGTISITSAAYSMLELTAVAVAVSLASNLVTDLYILRHRPMNILNNRN